MDFNHKGSEQEIARLLDPERILLYDKNARQKNLFRPCSHGFHSSSIRVRVKKMLTA
jgi:hypothetical protein